MRHSAAATITFVEGESMKPTNKKFRYWTIAIAALAGFTAGPVLAGKVSMPKEGPFAFDYCAIIEPQLLTSGDKVLVSHYRGLANVRTEPAGKPFDRTGVICYGTYANIN